MPGLHDLGGIAVVTVLGGGGGVAVPRHVDERFDMFGEVVGGHRGLLVLAGVDVEAGEDGLVEDATCPLAGPLVQRPRIGEQVTELADDGLPGGEIHVGGVELLANRRLLLRQVAHLGAELVLRPIRVADEVEVGVLLSFQVGEASGELGSDAGLGAVPVGHRGVDLRLDGGAKVLGQPDGGVVADHFVFYLVDG